ncbi:hypothetical protein [Vibrio cincinnatiensis]|uniref:hypothetical protein n=1 Tax=Vibrio cincinnatiensis TaxID=675 RepID=UPI001EE05DC5|nr:hypothetical protein [Vibrio cincinnatiensis]
MSVISPLMASELSNIVYDVKHNLNGIRLPAVIDDHFSFSKVAVGTSGGFFFRPKTGFALLGKLLFIKRMCEQESPFELSQKRALEYLKILQR